MQLSFVNAAARPVQRASLLRARPGIAQHQRFPGAPLLGPAAALARDTTAWFCHHGSTWATLRGSTHHDGEVVRRVFDADAQQDGARVDGGGGAPHALRRLAERHRVVGYGHLRLRGASCQRAGWSSSGCGGWAVPLAGSSACARIAGGIQLLLTSEDTSELTSAAGRSQAAEQPIRRQYGASIGSGTGARACLALLLLEEPVAHARSPSIASP